MTPEHVTDAELSDVERLNPRYPMASDDAVHWLMITAHKMAAELRALRAPVDVEAEVAAAADRALDTWATHRTEADRWARVVRPLIERAARLQREAEELRAEVARLKAEIDELDTVDRQIEERNDTARAEIERLGKAKTATERIADAWKALAQAEMAWRLADGALGKSDASRACSAAKAALRALDIDPDAP